MNHQVAQCSARVPALASGRHRWRCAGGSAAVALVACCLICFATRGRASAAASAGSKSATAFVGTVARDGTPPNVARDVDDAMRELLGKASGTRQDGCRAPLLRAKARLLDGAFADAQQDADACIAAFEAAPTPDDTAEFVRYLDALVVKAVAAARLSDADGADAALTKVATLGGDTLPDPNVATPKTVARLEALRAELRAARPATLDIATRPASAHVFFDGRPLGRSPVTVRGVLPGDHWLLGTSTAQRAAERVTIAGDEKLKLVLSAAPADAAALLRGALGEPCSATALKALAAPLGADVVAVVLHSARIADGERLVLLGVRVIEGETKVAAAFVDPTVDVAAAVHAVWSALANGDPPQHAFGGTVVERSALGDVRPLLIAAGGPDAATPQQRAVHRLDTPEAVASPPADVPWLAIAAAGAVVVIGAAVAVTAVTLSAHDSVQVSIDASQL